MTRYSICKMFSWPAVILVVAAASVWLRVHANGDDEKITFPDYPFLAAEHGDLESVKKHVEKDAKLLVKQDEAGYTILHYAAMGNQPDVIRYLAKKGAKVDQVDGNGNTTPLYNAAMSGRAHAVRAGRVLIDLGANPNWRFAAGKRTKSVLDTAASHGHAGLVKLLLKKGASPFTYGESFTEPRKKYLLYTSLHKACEGPLAAGYLVSPRFATKEYPSYIAEYEDNHKVIELLVPVVKDVNIKDSRGRTPLHVAALYGRSKIATYLLKKYPKVDINAMADGKNAPLHLAIKGGADYAKRFPNKSLEDYLETIKVLLKHKPDLTITNTDGQTPRARARATGNKAIMALFP